VILSPISRNRMKWSRDDRSRFLFLFTNIAPFYFRGNLGMDRAVFRGGQGATAPQGKSHQKMFVHIFLGKAK
jgi:hypothetical protein